MQCSGSEYNLTECEIRNDSVNHIRTNHSSDVGVKCQPGKGSCGIELLARKAYLSLTFGYLALSL